MLRRFVRDYLALMLGRETLEDEMERDREYSRRTGYTRPGALEREYQAVTLYMGRT